MEYRVEKLDESTWLIEEYDNTTSVYMYLLKGEKKAALIDTGMGTIPLREICEQLTELPIIVLLTHGHVDHIGGTAQFCEVYLHKADWNTYQLHSGELRKEFTDAVLPPVKETVLWMQDEEVFDLGGRTLAVIHAPGHSFGSVCFLDRERRWLFTGDTCCKAHVLLQMEYSAPPAVYLEAVKHLLRKREMYDLTWPGHHSKPVKTEILEQFREAAEGLLQGSMQGRDTLFGPVLAKLLLYKDIGIVYKKEE